MIRKEFIINELKYRYPAVGGAIRRPELPVGRPLFLEGENITLGPHVVVCRAAELNAARIPEQREPLFLCAGTPEQRVLDSLDVCILPDGEQTAAVLNFVQRLFDRLDEWLQQLKAAAESEKDIEELLRTAGEMLQNPVFLIDSMSHVVAQSGQADTKLEMIRSEAAGDRTLTEGAQNDTLSRDITVGGSTYTLLCTASERPLYGSDEFVFESLAGYVRLMLSEQKLYPSGTRNNHDEKATARALRLILSQETSDRNTIETLNSLGWNETDSYCVLAAEPADGDLRTARAAYLCERIEASLAGCCAFTETPVIVVILHSDFSKESNLRKTMSSLSTEEGLRFGVCEAYRGFSLLAQRLELAKYALTHAAGTDGVTFFHDAAEEYVSSRAVSNFPADLIMLRSVRALAESDHDHGTSYIETADRYLQNHFNAVKTASDLFIHRSTFLYRMERMKTQFGLDLESGDVSLLHLMLSLRIVSQESFASRQ